MFNSCCLRTSFPGFLRLLNRGVGLNVSRKYQTGLGDDSIKTTISVLNKQLDLGLMIDSYSQVGFRLNNGFALVGSIALFARTVLSWKVGTAEEINENTLRLFYLLEPKLEVLVIGYGSKRLTEHGLRGPTISGITTSTLAGLQRRKINLEVHPTEIACTTYNFLMSEGRYVAAALIPPDDIITKEMEVLDAKLKAKQLFEREIK
ncbi:hypothetical protein CHUAL_008519 [Chamberlinius hualienensis]